MLIFSGALVRVTEETIDRTDGDSFVVRTAVCECGLPNGDSYREYVRLAGKALEGYNGEPGSDVAFEVSVEAFVKKSGGCGTRLKAWREAPAVRGADA